MAQALTNPLSRLFHHSLSVIARPSLASALRAALMAAIALHAAYFWRTIYAHCIIAGALHFLHEGLRTTAWPSIICLQRCRAGMMSAHDDHCREVAARRETMTSGSLRRKRRRYLSQPVSALACCADTRLLKIIWRRRAARRGVGDHHQSPLLLREAGLVSQMSKNTAPPSQISLLPSRQCIKASWLVMTRASSRLIPSSFRMPTACRRLNRATVDL